LQRSRRPNSDGQRTRPGPNLVGCCGAMILGAVLWVAIIQGVRWCRVVLHGPYAHECLENLLLIGFGLVFVFWCMWQLARLEARGRCGRKGVRK